MATESVDIAIIGAGPYGLSLAAHLRGNGRSLRIFGDPMRFWSNNMPRGMSLKSEGFASDLYDPKSEFTLKSYCASNGLPYADIGLPVSIDTFVAYGKEFQRRYVPQLENVDIQSVKEAPAGFELTTAAGEVLHARNVVVATGIMNFAYLPPSLAKVTNNLVTHSSQHGDMARFAGRHVAVVGGGASAIDVAVALGAAGANVEIVSRGGALRFHDKPNEPRPLIDRIKAPRSGLGVGWRSRLCSDAPLVFHRLPQALRFRAVSRHLGPAPCWFTRDAIVGRMPVHIGKTLADVSADQGKVRLAFGVNGHDRSALEVDHVIAATGYRVAVSRLKFIDQGVKSRIRTADDTPVLGRHFETSLRGLYFVGAAAANSFGPLLRFAYGARFTARQVSKHLSNA